jgi:hypothetical protein
MLSGVIYKAVLAKYCVYLGSLALDILDFGVKSGWEYLFV